MPIRSPQLLSDQDSSTTSSDDEVGPRRLQGPNDGADPDHLERRDTPGPPDESSDAASDASDADGRQPQGRGHESSDAAPAASTMDASGDATPTAPPLDAVMDTASAPAVDDSDEPAVFPIRRVDSALVFESPTSLDVVTDSDDPEHPMYWASKLDQAIQWIYDNPAAPHWTAPKWMLNAGFAQQQRWLRAAYSRSLDSRGIPQGNRWTVPVQVGPNEYVVYPMLDGPYPNKYTSPLFTPNGFLGFAGEPEDIVGTPIRRPVPYEPDVPHNRFSQRPYPSTASVGTSPIPELFSRTRHCDEPREPGAAGGASSGPGSGDGDLNADGGTSTPAGAALELEPLRSTGHDWEPPPSDWGSADGADYLDPYVPPDPNNPDNSPYKPPNARLTFADEVAEEEWLQEIGWPNLDRQPVNFYIHAIAKSLGREAAQRAREATHEDCLRFQRERDADGVSDSSLDFYVPQPDEQPADEFHRELDSAPADAAEAEHAAAEEGEEVQAAPVYTEDQANPDTRQVPPRVRLPGDTAHCDLPEYRYNRRQREAYQASLGSRPKERVVTIDGASNRICVVATPTDDAARRGSAQVGTKADGGTDEARDPQASEAAESSLPPHRIRLRGEVTSAAPDESSEREKAPTPVTSGSVDTVATSSGPAETRPVTAPGAQAPERADRPKRGERGGKKARAKKRQNERRLRSENQYVPAYPIVTTHGPVPISINLRDGHLEMAIREGLLGHRALNFHVEREERRPCNLHVYVEPTEPAREPVW